MLDRMRNYTRPNVEAGPVTVHTPIPRRTWVLASGDWRAGTVRFSSLHSHHWRVPRRAVAGRARVGGVAPHPAIDTRIALWIKVY
jgi:hypothetical protein